jgi:Flp pilus assembly protein TadG
MDLMSLLPRSLGRALSLRQRARASVRDGVISRLRRDERGHALVEGALVFPLMISLFFGVSEYSEALTVSRRVEGAAATGADLVARLRTVSNADLAQIKPMLDEMIRPFPTASLGLVLTSVVADADNNTTVAWSYAEGAGVSQRAAGSAVALPAGLTDPGESVILAEVRYTFRSTLTTLIVGDVPMAVEAYVRPRLTTHIEKTD